MPSVYIEVLQGIASSYMPEVQFFTACIQTSLVFGNAQSKRKYNPPWGFFVVVVFWLLVFKSVVLTVAERKSKAQNLKDVFRIIFFS